MTYKEKLQTIKPENVGERWGFGCKGCPGAYFEGAPIITKNACSPTRYKCANCWDQIIEEDGNEKI